RTCPRPGTSAESGSSVGASSAPLRPRKPATSGRVYRDPPSSPRGGSAMHVDPAGLGGSIGVEPASTVPRWRRLGYRIEAYFWFTRFPFDSSLYVTAGWFTATSHFTWRLVVVIVGIVAT